MPASTLFFLIGTCFWAIVAFISWGLLWHYHHNLVHRARLPFGTPTDDGASDDNQRPSITAPEKGKDDPKSRYAAGLVDMIPLMALAVDPMGQIITCNHEAQECFGDRLPALMRHPSVRDTLKAALRAPPEAESAQATSCSTTVTLDVPVKLVVNLTMRRLPETNKRRRYVLILLTDRSAARAVDRIRADFVAHASHELRTPLASLSGFIDLLKNEDPTEDPSSRTLFLNIMEQQATRMQRLIDRLLYLSQLQLREHRKPHTSLDIAELFAIILGEVTPRFEQSNRHLRLAHDDNLIIRADEDEMVQVLLNLIENALRYGTHPERDLQISLTARRATADDEIAPHEGGILLTVEDNGPGIAPKHLPRLTERFYRVNASTTASNETNSPQGTGLGLAIVRQIMDRHGGRLQFTSIVGEGTRCLIWLPAYQTETSNTPT